MSAGIRVKIVGVEEMSDELRRLTKTFGTAAAAATYEEALAVDADMVPRIPVDTGRMRGTHFVTPPELDGEVYQCRVGVATEYAIFVHERTELQHAVGEAKFLERALMSRMSGMGTRLAARTKAHAAAGITSVPTSSTPTAPRDTGGTSQRSSGRGRGRGRGRRGDH